MPVQGRGTRSWRESSARLSCTLLAGAGAALLAAGCGSGGATAGDNPAAASTPAAARTGAGATAPPSMAYKLYTHCGIDEAKVGGRFYQAVTPLSDGNGNPPPGWGNPYQAGTMTLVSTARAVFTDKAGHRVVFALDMGRKTFKHVCS